MFSITLSRLSTKAWVMSVSLRETTSKAFYADCPHEVRPLRGGYRLCLVYNVTLTRPRRTKRLGAPSYGALTARVAELLGTWRGRVRRRSAW